MESITNGLFNLSLSEGLFAALFVALFLYVLYDTNRREKDYIKIIESNNETIRDNNNIIITLTQKLKVVDSINEKVTEITHKMGD